MQAKQQRIHTPEDWQEVERIFIEALNLPTEAREQFLEDACRHNRMLREEIDSLLASHIETVGVLDAFDINSAAGLLKSQLPEHVISFGPYRTVKELGRGGMGTVYEAQRDDGQFDQKVALKVIKSGMSSDKIVQQFLKERQILAKLQHANIAQLLDGGINSEGRPFFAMEYIKGSPITQYCDIENLTINERLGLFLDVCEAIGYAHRNLIIHRDLKPGNILVTDEGQVKLLDFGIAKILDGASNYGDQQTTETGLKALTPEYAAPEQIKSEAVTTSADVYALGVVLYELLVGSRPYLLKRQSIGEVVTAICHKEPLTPLQALDRMSDEGNGMLARVAECRGVTIQKLRRQLTGDIEAMLLKALQKNPEDRYASVEALQEDITRFLKHMPLKAAESSTGYVMKKFVRRHHWAVGGIGLFILMLSVFSTVLGIQANNLATERNKSRLEAEKAIAVATFLESIFESSKPTNLGDEEITAAELLNKGMVRVEERYAGQPEIQVLLTQILGRVHYNMNMYPEAENVLRLALEKSLAVEGASSLLTAENKFYLARTIAVLENEGWASEAEQLMREALAIQKEAGSDINTIASTLSTLGFLLHKTGDKEGASKVAREAVEMMEASFTGLNAEGVSKMFEMASLLRYAGDQKEAEALYLFLIEHIDPVDQAAQIDLANAHQYLASLYTHQTRHDEAVTHVEISYQIKKDLPDFELKSMMASREHYALALSHVGRHDEAIALQAIVQNYWSTQDPNVELSTAYSSFNFGKIYGRKGDLKQAEFWFREAGNRYEKILGKDHFRNALVGTELANLFLKGDNFTQAREEIEPALQILIANFGPTYALVLDAQTLKAQILLAQGELDQATQLLESLVSGTELPEVGGHIRNIKPVLFLAEAYQAIGRREEAVALLEQHYAHYLNVQGVSGPFTVKLQAALEAIDTSPAV